MSQHARADVTKLLFSIQKEHLSYFATDDDAIKQQKIKPLREIIIRYLSLVKHRNKFSMPEFERILQRNIEDRFDFNACETQQAFDILEKYASNLISYPWRKEFCSIKLYCGFYKHNLARHLYSAEKILNLMGYQLHENGIMTLDGPADPDMLIEVSRNCFIASCECQIIYEIYSTVLEIGYACSYEDVYNMRKCLVGSSESIIQMLCAKEQAENLFCRKPQERVAKIDNNISFQTDKNGMKRTDPSTEPLIDLSTPNETKRKNISNEIRPCQMDRKLDPLHASSMPPSKEIFENKKVTNVNAVNVNIKKEKDDIEKDILKVGTHEDHIKASITAVHDYHKDSPEHVSTRDESWGFMDKNLQDKGLSQNYRNYSNLYDDSFEYLQTLNKSEDENKFSKGRLNNQSLQQQQQQELCSNPQYYAMNQNIPPSQYPIHPSMQHQSPPPYQAANNKRDMVASEICPNRYPEPSAFGLPSLQFHRAIAQCSYIPTRMMLPHQLQYFPYSPVIPPSWSTAPSSSIENGLAESLQSMHVTDSNNLNTNFSPMSNVSSVEENRRSFYDNVPEKDDRLPDNFSHSSPQKYSDSQSGYLDHSFLNNVEESAEKIYNRKSSDASLSNSYSSERENIKTTKHQTKTRNSDYSNTVSDKEKGSPLVQRRAGNDKKPQSRTEVEIDKWTCNHCTYLNPVDKKICEVCCRSRTPGPEMPLQSGGHECPKCTLVNDQNATHCTACGDNLTDSPTYI